MRTRKPKVAIFGSGAAAGFAYRACLDFDCSAIDIYSARETRPSASIQFLRWLPKTMGASYNPKEIMLTTIGQPQVFVQKMNSGYWKREWIEQAEVPSKKEFVHGWPASDVWEDLWQGADITYLGSDMSDAEIKDIARAYGIAFLTFPSRESLQAYSRYVIKLPTRVYNFTPRFGDKLSSIVGSSSNFVIYNGSQEYPWVRMACLFGRFYQEFPPTLKIEEEEDSGCKVEMVPTLHPEFRASLNPLSPNIIPTGKWATWNVKEMAHHSYDRATRYLQKFMEGEI